MDASVKKIVQLLGDERIERRCAAAIVIGELGLKEPEVAEALGHCLREDHRLLQLYALEALGGVRSPKIAALVTPLLDHPDEEVRTRAAALLGEQGAKATAAMVKELAADGVPVARRRALVSILARGRDAATMDRLLGLLGDAEIGEYTLNALRAEVEHLPADGLEALRTRLTALLKDQRVLADEGATGRALRLLGYGRSPKALKLILSFAEEKHPAAVRLAALSALRRPLGAGNAGPPPAGVLELLFRAADDPDATLARAALDTLRGLQLPEGASGALLELSEGQHADARKFALEALGRSGSGKVVKSLIAHLDAADPAAREAAAASLARLDGAGPALAKELEAVATAAPADLDRVRLLCRLVRRRAEELKPAQRQGLADLTLAAMEASRPAAEPLLELLAAVDSPLHARLLAERAHAHRKAKRFPEALALFGKLEGAGQLDDDGRYAAIVAGLATRPSKKELARASRTTDPVLKHIVSLLGHGDPVSRKLVKEKSVTDEDLFYIGFNFVESKDEDEREFGGELLSHLAERAPRSKLGRSAKNKLHLVGLE